jgi:ComF family protein
MPLFRIVHFFLDLKDAILDLIYPQSCPICQRPLEKGIKEVCEKCWNTLASLPAPFCPYCKSFLEHDDPLSEHLCPSLNKSEDRKILAVRSLGTFDEYYQKLVHRFKYDKKIPLGRRLAQFLGEMIAKDRYLSSYDQVIPVPLHRTRQRERGFNQSAILAEGISQEANLSLIKGILKRKRNTKDQTYLNAQQRSENVKGAFVVSQPEEVSDKKIILVDDVTTTGATLNECAEMLRKAGAKEIFAVTLAVVVD